LIRQGSSKGSIKTSGWLRQKAQQFSVTTLT
jgi:hypothetical protein